MHEKANGQLVRKLNESRVLNLIKEKGVISRNELARQSKIFKVAISEIVSRLDKAGYILEIGKGKSTNRGGKRPILLKLNPAAAYVFGVEIKRSRTNIALADIESTIREISTFEYEPGLPMEYGLDRIIQIINQLMEKHRLDRRRLRGIGLCLPGFVNYSKGELLFAETLSGWADRPLASRFTSHFRAPTVLENDVNAITLGEKILGAGRGKSNLICIWIGEGIGAGIIMGGQLIRGENGNAGEIGYIEIGHFVAVKNQFKNLYRNQKYYGEILSNINLFRALNDKLGKNYPILPGKIDQNALKKMLTKAENGAPGAIEVLDEYAFLIAILCMNLIKTMNPNLIILSGPVIENSNYLLKKIRSLVKQRMVNIPFEASTIVVGDLKAEAGVKGAITMALQTIFEPPVTQSNNHINLPAEKFYSD
ncbi:MAG TPA: ROK family transcriptional regulator [bacterium]|nr:ROK family transcriptional regulator [bacterium]